MTYEPTNWKDGDLVTSAKLNKMEQGIASGGGILFVSITPVSESSLELDKTWQEIYDASFVVFTYFGEEQKTVITSYYAYVDVNSYHVELGSYDLVTDSPDGYPQRGNK